MQVSRGVFDVGTATRKLLSRFRRPLQIARHEWPVISTTRPLFYLIRLFGLAPFQVSEDHFIPGSYNVIYSLFCTLVQTYLAYLVLDRFVSISRGGRVLDITETGKVVFNYIVALLSVLIAVGTRKEFIGVLNIIKNYDSRIRDLGYPRKEGATRVWVWTTCVSTVLLWIIVSLTGILAFAEPWAQNVTYLLNYLATSMSIVKFSSVVLLLGQRFRHLNKIAKHRKESTMTRESRVAIDPKVIQQLHDGLMNAGESLSSQHEWLLLLWLINLCMHSVSNVYFLINWLMVSPVEWADSQIFFVVCISSWLTAFIGQLILLHVACDFTSTEANSIGSILANRESLNTSRNYAVKSSLHLIHRKLNFSAAGCFYVNLPLLRSIAALLTTYLILLMQFES